jgi:hypothetical protein
VEPAGALPVPVSGGYISLHRAKFSPASASLPQYLSKTGSTLLPINLPSSRSSTNESRAQ